MKNVVYKCFSFIAAVLVSNIAMAQSGTNSARAFKDIYKTQEPDRHLEKEIKRKELQKAPLQVYIDTTIKSPIIKKKKYRRNKKLN